jgi:hypothetical protein
MAKMQPKPAGKPRRELTLDEIKARVEKMRRDPKILALLHQGIEEEKRGEGTRWEDLQEELKRANG